MAQYLCVVKKKCEQCYKVDPFFNNNKKKKNVRGKKNCLKVQSSTMMSYRNDFLYV